METSEAIERPHNDRKTKVDWPSVKRRWIAGDSPTQICSDYAMHEQTLYSRARRDEWPKRPTHVIPLSAEQQIAKQTKSVVIQQVREMGPEIPALIKAQLQEHFAGVLGTVKTLHRRVNGYAETTQEVEEIRSLSSSLETIDRVARRTFGLDSPDGRNLGALVSCATSVSCPASGSTVIDVVAEPVTPASSV